MFMISSSFCIIRFRAFISQSCSALIHQIFFGNGFGGSGGFIHGIGQHVSDSNAFCGLGKYDSGSEDEADIRPGPRSCFRLMWDRENPFHPMIRCHFSGTTKSVRTKHVLRPSTTTYKFVTLSYI